MDDSNNHLSLRKVIKTDDILLFDWTNDPDVRKWSFNKNSITLDVHKIWFKQKFNDVNVLMWIFEVNSTPAGLVRLEKDNSEVVLNYLISSESRGKGLASKMLKIAMNEIRSHWQNIKVFAYTLPENIASIKSLERAGFYLESSSNEKNCYIFCKTKKIGAVYE
jgi:UDP-2,4-diacetamido-2,4,6-trideoxy-beta-L-altropyranose hydrolase